MAGGVSELVQAPQSHPKPLLESLCVRLCLKFRGWLGQQRTNLIWALHTVALMWEEGLVGPGHIQKTRESKFRDALTGHQL